MAKRIETEVKKLDEHIYKTKGPGLKSYHYNPNCKSFTFHYEDGDKGKAYTFAFDLGDNYPNTPPSIHYNPSLAFLTPYKLQPSSLDLFLPQPWTSNTFLCDLAEKYGQYLASLVPSATTRNSPSSLQRLFLHPVSLNYTALPVILVLLVSLLLRYGTGTAGYSGRGNPPDYGDFEVHRHWMELAVNLPVHEWYQESEREYAYKGIDYPPFCVYLHYVMGRGLKWLIPQSVELHDSRGYESDSLKLFMRSTIVVLDLLVFCTGFMYFLHKFYKNLETTHKLSYLFLAINIPCMLLIDHGHFHHNCVMLGLCLWSASFILSGQYVLGTFIYCLAINFKHMCLYYSLVFFFFVLAKLFAKHSPNTKLQGLLKVLLLGGVVVATNAVLWAPYLFAENGIWRVMLRRIFPVYRGLYEDKVANFWCFMNNFVKLRLLFSQDLLTLLSTGCTLVGCVPSVFMMVKKPNRKAFIMSLFNVSMSFYQFSYMVHEKTILLPLLPLTMLFYAYSHVFTAMMLFGLFSNFFLLRRDECTVPYFAILVLYSIVGYDYETSYVESLKNVNEVEVLWIDRIIGLVKRSHRHLKVLTLGVIGVFHVVEWIVKPPEKLPDIFLVLNVNVSFLVFFSVWIYSHLLLYKHVRESSDEDTDLIGGYKLPIKTKKE